MPVLVGTIVSPVLSITIVTYILNHANVNRNNYIYTSIFGSVRIGLENLRGRGRVGVYRRRVGKRVTSDNVTSKGKSIYIYSTYFSY